MKRVLFLIPIFCLSILFSNNYTIKAATELDFSNGFFDNANESDFSWKGLSSSFTNLMDNKTDTFKSFSSNTSVILLFGAERDINVESFSIYTESQDSNIRITFIGKDERKEITINGIGKQDIPVNVNSVKRINIYFPTKTEVGEIEFFEKKSNEEQADPTNEEQADPTNEEQADPTNEEQTEQTESMKFDFSNGFFDKNPDKFTINYPEVIDNNKENSVRFNQSMDVVIDFKEGIDILSFYAKLESIPGFSYDFYSSNGSIIKTLDINTQVEGTRTYNKFVDGFTNIDLKDVKKIVIRTSRFAYSALISEFEVFEKEEQTDPTNEEQKESIPDLGNIKFPESVTPTNLLKSGVELLVVVGQFLLLGLVWAMMPKLINLFRQSFLNK